ncbi:MAG: twin-arginine translocase subunit TatC, partial [Thermoplasmata archaeon]|nr:twin-arginine translocase subunit TatC [Thermoplasmata archaeon]
PFSVRVPGLPWRVPLAYPYPNFFDNVTAQVFRALVAWTLPPNVTLLNVGVGDSVIVQMEIAFLLTLILGMPWLVHEVAAFLVPALRTNERRLIRQIGIPASILFAIGTLLGILYLTPFTFRLLFLYVTAMGLQPAVGIQQFATFALLYSLAFGVVFELPVFVYSLTRLGVVKASAWRAHWRGAIIGCLVFGMIVTPDNSPFPMALIALPMLGLYFSGAFFAARWERGRDLQQAKEPPRLAAGA